ncbi:MAG: HAMP domain-containing histidine kinase [Bacteroidetes bacterium]|nr:HAMP domain-containing histidine kinase [Bacteroidota bacterium]
MNTRNRIALFSGLIGVIIVLIFGVSVYFFQNNYAYEDFYKRLETRAKITSQYRLNNADLDTAHLMSLREQYLEKLEKEKAYFIPLKSRRFDSLERIYKVPASIIKQTDEAGWIRERVGNLFYAGFKTLHSGRHYIVIISAENYYVTHHLLFLRNILVVGLLLVIIIILVFTFYYSRYIYEPISKIIKDVRMISSENIHLRLDQTTDNQELRDLIHTFNDLLGRIETGFETQKNFISNASHELATPLTSIIGEAEVTLLKERTAKEYELAIQNILKKAERLDQITRSLLFLAQTGYRGNVMGFERLRIDEVIWQTLKLMDTLIPDNKITFDIGLLPEDPLKLKVKGNRELLQMAFANILNNACKYSTNKPVRVSVASSDSNIHIVIEDKGIGIPKIELDKIYDPFFRATNTKLFEGYGIGLPLTRNVIRLHGGNLEVHSTIHVGTTVYISFPIFEPLADSEPIIYG